MSEELRNGAELDGEKPTPRVTIRGVGSFLLKLAVAALLVTWLVRSGALDLGALRVLLVSPTLLAANLLAWFVCSVVLATLRWRVLLSLAGVSLGLWRALQLQLMALFLNVAIPGNVGGDVIKALYVARDADRDKKPAILLVVFVERLLGLIGLVAVGALATALGGPTLWNNPTMRPMVRITGALALAFVAGPLVAVPLLNRFAHVRSRIPVGSSRFAQLAHQVLQAGRLLVARPGILLLSLALSMAMHGTAMGYFTLLTRAVTAQAANYGVIATVFPLGLLTIVLPISPAGIGVGHLAFDQLYRAVGLSGGATIFNIFLVGQIVPCALGAVPFLLLRSRSILGPGPRSDNSKARGTAQVVHRLR